MASDIHFSEHEAEFSFKQNDVTYHVRTEVGDGPARVVVSELREHEELPMEKSE